VSLTINCPDTRGNIDRLIDADASWVVITANSGDIDRCRAYLPEPHVWQIHRWKEGGYADLAIACVTREWAQWTVDRLASGLYGATAHDTYAEAEARLIEVAF
jgi:hypothetical protein